MRFTLRQVLGRAAPDHVAHAVTETGDAAAGIAAVEDSEFDLALVDMIMPARSGLDVVPAILSRWPNMRVIAISGGMRTDNGSMLATAQRMGVHDVLRKPFTARELRTAVDRVLGVAGVEEGMRGLRPSTPPGAEPLDL